MLFLRFDDLFASEIKDVERLASFLGLVFPKSYKKTKGYKFELIRRIQREEKRLSRMPK